MPSSPGTDQPAATEPSTANAPSTGETPPAGQDAPQAGADLQDELARMEDRFKRALADLDNYRKRAGREIERRVQEAREALLRDFLEPLDSLERALRALPEDDRCRDGMQAVMGQMDATLMRYGVQRFGAPGEPFDPVRHEAIGVHETADAPDRSVLDVARSGFALGDRVLRPAQVIVARRPEAGTS
jgi:molecular chaperone GrpE